MRVGYVFEIGLPVRRMGHKQDEYGAWFNHCGKGQAAGNDAPPYAFRMTRYYELPLATGVSEGDRQKTHIGRVSPRHTQSVITSRYD